ncbi:MAG: hypothetical protein ACT4OZ_17010 [Gemmatimonadota bacterium]
MSDTLGFRAELANQIAAGLRRLTDDDWSVVEARSSIAADYILLACNLATSALNLLEEEHGRETRSMVEKRLADLEAAFPNDEKPATGLPRVVLARALLLAAVLRGSRGFNHGAWLELSLPFRGLIDVADAERIARGVMLPGASDFSAVGPARQEPPDDRAAGGDARSA